MRKVISWMFICIGILCIYINVINVFNEDKVILEEAEVNIVTPVPGEEILIEDELIPGGQAKVVDHTIINEQILHIGAIVITGIGIYINHKQR